MSKKIVSGSTTIIEDPNTGEKIITCKDSISGVENTTTINNQTHKVESKQTPPKNFHPTSSSSSKTEYHAHNLTKTCNNQLVKSESSETYLVSGDAAQPTDQQG